MRLNRRKFLKMTTVEDYFTMGEWSWLLVSFLIGDCNIDGINDLGDSESKFREEVKDGN